MKRGGGGKRKSRGWGGAGDVGDGPRGRTGGRKGTSGGLE